MNPSAMQAFYPGGFSSFGMDPRNFNAMFSEMVEPMATFSTQITNAPSEIKKTGPRPIMPRVDCCDTDECFCVWVDLCGCEKKDVSASIVDGQLHIEATKAECCTIKDFTGKNPHWIMNERNTGKFARTIKLPSNVLASSKCATFKDGVLHMKFDKVEGDPSGVVKLVL